MLRALLAILQKDLHEIGLPMLPLGLFTAGSSLALAASGYARDPLAPAASASLILLAGVALPILTILREKTRGTWDWLRLLSPNPRLLPLAKLGFFLILYSAFCLSLLPLWASNPDFSSKSSAWALWFICCAAGWVLGCLLFMLLIALRRGFLVLILSLCSIQMFASAVLMLAVAEGGLVPGNLSLPAGQLWSPILLLALTGIALAILAVEVGARFNGGVV